MEETGKTLGFNLSEHQAYTHQPRYRRDSSNDSDRWSTCSNKKRKAGDKASSSKEGSGIELIIIDFIYILGKERTEIRSLYEVVFRTSG